MTILSAVKMDGLLVDHVTDPATFQDGVVAKLREQLVRDLIDRARKELFGPMSKEEFEAFVYVLLNDPDIRAKMAAYRTKKRLLGEPKHGLGGESESLCL